MTPLNIIAREVPGTKIKAWSCISNPVKAGRDYLDGYILVRVQCNGSNENFPLETWQLQLVCYRDGLEHEIKTCEEHTEVPIEPDMVLEQIETSVVTGTQGPVGTITLKLWSEEYGYKLIHVYCTDKDEQVPTDSKTILMH